MQLDGKPYTVKQGDNLWDIAAKHLGSGDQWPRIYSFTNSDHAQSLGASCIDDPDVLRVGNVLRLPIASGQPVAKSGAQQDCARPNISHKEQIQNKTKSVTVGYDLQDAPPVIFMGPGYKATIRFQGTLVLTSKNKAPIAYVGNAGLTKSVQEEADAIIAKLISATSFSYDPKTNKMTFKNMLIVHSHYAYLPKFAIGVKTDSVSLVPKIFGDIYYPELKGEIQGWAFLVAKFKIVIEIEPSTFPGSKPTPPAPVYQDYTAPQYDNPGTNWVLVGAYVVATGIIVGTIIEDFLTLGVGILDDGPSFALAAAIILMAKQSGSSPVTPKPGMMSL